MLTYVILKLYSKQPGLFWQEGRGLLKKLMLHLVPAAIGEEFFELNWNEPRAVLASKNHTGGLYGSEDLSDGKIFLQASSRRCPVQVLKAYLSHLNPNSDALFQKPKDLSSANFNPAKENSWYESERKLGHSTLENFLRKMTDREELSLTQTIH